MRALLVVLDSAGIGHAPDAARYGDIGANTLAMLLIAIPRSDCRIWNRLGLNALLGRTSTVDPRASFGRMRERSAGKDTTTGHWKIAGVILEEPFFAGSGIGQSHPTVSNEEGMRLIDHLWAEERRGLIFASLVDSDMLFGHRRDAAGYARALEEFDYWLGTFLPRIKPDDHGRSRKRSHILRHRSHA